ncbi:hypothetical protein BKA57DRAFT_305711 [Linnemannia elongata]|nr:hypothetical protein BKA57DRAFT_305711 [Linnemannia elongata]
MSVQPYPTLLTLDHTKTTTSLSPPRPTTTAIPTHIAPTVSNTNTSSITNSTTPVSSSSNNFNNPTIHAPKAGRRTSSRQTTLESLLGPTLRLPIPSKANKPFLPEIKDGALRDSYSYSRDGSSGSEDEQDAEADDTYDEDNDDYEYNNGDQEQDGEEDDGEDENGVRSKEDPLASQVWKMYSKAKDSLDGQRMENMTWRMMSLSLHKKDTAVQNTPNQPSPFSGVCAANREKKGLHELSPQTHTDTTGQGKKRKRDGSGVAKGRRKIMNDKRGAQDLWIRTK